MILEAVEVRDYRGTRELLVRFQTASGGIRSLAYPLPRQSTPGGLAALFRHVGDLLDCVRN